MTNSSVKKTLHLAGLLPAFFLMCACSDELDIAAEQARGGAYKLAIKSYQDYLAKNPGKKTAAKLNYEIGVLLVKDNRKEEALLSFKTAAENGYAADKIRAALRELVGEINTANVPAAREMLTRLRDINDDFKEYADIQLFRFQNLETEARRLVSVARENIARGNFDEAGENLSKAKTLVPGIILPGAAEMQKDMPDIEAAFYFEQHMKSAFHVFDKTRKPPTGARFTVAGYDKFKELERLDTEKRREIDDAVANKALGKSAQERAGNEAAPGFRYQDFLSRRYGLRFTVALPAYNPEKRGIDISATYEAWPCHGLELTFPVIETGEALAGTLAKAKTPVLVEVVFNIVPKNISKILGREKTAAGCSVISGRASIGDKTVHLLRK